MFIKPFSFLIQSSGRILSAGKSDNLHSMSKDGDLEAIISPKTLALDSLNRLKSKLSIMILFPTFLKCPSFKRSFGKSSIHTPPLKALIL